MVKLGQIDEGVTVVKLPAHQLPRAHQPLHVAPRLLERDLLDVFVGGDIAPTLAPLLDASGTRVVSSERQKRTSFKLKKYAVEVMCTDFQVGSRIAQGCRGHGHPQPPGRLIGGLA